MHHKSLCLPVGTPGSANRGTPASLLCRFTILPAPCSARAAAEMRRLLRYSASTSATCTALGRAGRQASRVAVLRQLGLAGCRRERAYGCQTALPPQPVTRWGLALNHLHHPSPPAPPETHTGLRLQADRRTPTQALHTRSAPDKPAKPPPPPRRRRPHHPHHPPPTPHLEVQADPEEPVEVDVHGEGLNHAERGQRRRQAQTNPRCARGERQRGRGKVVVRRHMQASLLHPSGHGSQPRRPRLLHAAPAPARRARPRGPPPSRPRAGASAAVPHTRTTPPPLTTHPPKHRSLRCRPAGTLTRAIRLQVLQQEL